jgi:hypothetical protein
LRIADSFGQHLAKLSLRLRFSREGFLPLGHGQYVGMREGELNPAGLALAPKLRNTRQGPWGMD